MDSSPTRRRTLQLGGTALAAGLAGCFGTKSVEGTLSADGAGRINETRLPERKKYRTPEATFPYYRRYRAEDADTVLVLLHTAALDSRVVQPLAAAIAEANAAHVFTPDLRGHGPNPERRGDVDYVGQLEDDLKHLIESAQLAHPDSTVVVAGHGAGGGIVVRFGSRPYGTLADGVLLLAPYLGFNAPTTRKGLGGWANFYMDRVIMLRVLSGFGIEGYNDMTAVEFDIPDAVADGPVTPAHTYRLMKSYTPEEGEINQMVEVPCLTLAGTADETADAEAYEPLFADRPNAEVQLLDGVSHLSAVLDDTVLDPIVTWLKKTEFDSG